MYTRTRITAISLLLAATLTGCATDTPTGAEDTIGPRTPFALDPLAAVTSPVQTCPPAIPIGYSLVFCFDFTSMPGVWHGFIVGSAIPPVPPATVGTLSADYVLLSPAGLTRIPPQTFGDPAVDHYTFQVEFFNGAWIDVLRFSTANGQPPQQFKLAVLKPLASPQAHATALANAVAQLVASGDIGAGVATGLLARLERALAMIADGRNETAVALLQSFVATVEALMKSGAGGVSAAEGQRLVDGATSLIARLTS